MVPTHFFTCKYENVVQYKLYINIYHTYLRGSIAKMHPTYSFNRSFQGPRDGQQHRQWAALCSAGPGEIRAAEPGVGAHGGAGLC